MIFDEGHKEPEPNQNHHIHILIHGVKLSIGRRVVVEFGTNEDSVQDDDNDFDDEE